MAERNEYGLEWDPTVFEGEDFTCLGWPGLTEDEFTDDDDIMMLDTGKIYVALPKDVCLEEGFVEDDPDGAVYVKPDMERDIWTFFSNYGDQLETIRDSYDVATIECTGDVDFKEFDRKVKAKGEEPLRPGERCLADYNLVYEGAKPMDGVVIPYERFLERLSETVVQAGTTEIESDGAGGKLRKMKVVFGNPRLEKADTEAEWNKAYGAEGTFDGSCDHRLFCSMSIQSLDSETNKYKEIFYDPEIKVANIPAMNPENGLFLHNGNEYAIAMQADPRSFGRRIETAGMFLDSLLRKGMKEMCGNVLETLRNTDLDANSISNVLKERNRKDLFSADKYIKDMMSGAEEYQGRWRRVGDGDAAPVARMRIPLTVLIPKPICVNYEKGALFTQEAEQEDIIEPLDDLGDSYARSSGKKITGKFVLGMGVRITDDGIPCLPFYRIKDGKLVGRGSENVVWLPVHAVGVIKDELIRKYNEGFDPKLYDEKGRPKFVEWLTDGMETADDLPVVHPEDIHADGNGLFTDEQGRIVVRFAAPMPDVNSNQAFLNSYGIAYPADGTEMYALVDSRCMLAPGSNANANHNQIDATRNAIGESNSNQACPIAPGSQAAAVGPRVSKAEELAYGKYAAAEFDGTVSEIQKGEPLDGRDTYISMTIVSEDGKNRQVVDMSERRYGGGDYVYRQVPSDGIEVGSKVHKGDVLTDASGIVDGQAKVGYPMMVGFIPGGAELNDDCILVRESFAKKCMFELRDEFSEEYSVEAGANPYGPTVIVNPLKGRDPDKGTVIEGHDYSGLGEDGMIPDGSVVEPGDVIAYRLVPNMTKHLDMGEQQIMKSFGSFGSADEVPEGYKRAPIIYEGDIPGTIRTFRKRDQAEGTERLVWTVTSYMDMDKLRSKMSDSGIKGAVQIVPDDKFYYIAQNAGDATGKKLDIVMGGFSETKRKNAASITEGLMSFIGLCLGRRIEIPSGTRELAQAATALVRESGLGLEEDGTVRIVSPSDSLKNFYGTVIVADISMLAHFALTTMKTDDNAKLVGNLKQGNVNARGVHDYLQNVTSEKNIDEAAVKLRKQGVNIERSEKKDSRKKEKTGKRRYAEKISQSLA